MNKLIFDVKRSLFEGTGKPEPLKENSAGFWSRRIEDTNRLVCDVDESMSRPVVSMKSASESGATKTNSFFSSSSYP
ncbi:type II toxin-antitoxin system YoeB family toxin [Vibrio sp. TRT 2004]|uniref:type II toxin-antitoxin system YoeB family toxin n=1 Tax=Vibrio sp. TRT 2004 TaxID=3418506 RepID=UPI003CF38436